MCASCTSVQDCLASRTFDTGGLVPLASRLPKYCALGSLASHPSYNRVLHSLASRSFYTRILDSLASRCDPTSLRSLSDLAIADLPLDISRTPSKRPRIRHPLSTPSMQGRVIDRLSPSSSPNTVAQHLTDLKGNNILLLLNFGQDATQAHFATMKEDNRTAAHSHSQQLVLI